MSLNSTHLHKCPKQKGTSLLLLGELHGFYLHISLAWNHQVMSLSPVLSHCSQCGVSSETNTRFIHSVSHSLSSLGQQGSSALCDELFSTFIQLHDLQRLEGWEPQKVQQFSVPPLDRCLMPDQLSSPLNFSASNSFSPCTFLFYPPFSLLPHPSWILMMRVSITFWLGSVMILSLGLITLPCRVELS